ncbi:Pc12g14020 [Penicillium rubens Wisconsin 54-1255]|uniref:Synaptobrevin homolog YKT6 n=1 Tax=Penicillium rubens (strain ATCC 28089 / DSM 1075 / NRRL 1951 / Wisconsin 54-1255) TaxID=500485 RepID=B6H0I9_PENRW|nr:Pc12g14020 [Penicillium rubens Wisconsin 54-1255]
MKILYIGVFRNDTQPALQLCGEKDLSSFSRFTRQKYAHTSSLGPICYDEFLMLFTRTVAEKTKPGQRQDIEEKAYTFHAYGRTEGVAGVIVTDGDYPALVAHQLLGKIVDEFLAKHPRTAFSDPSLRENACPLPQLKEYIVKYQDPSQADSIMKIQQELDETKIVLHKTIESVLERGEKIDSLVQKSDGLSAQSKMFYTQAKKQNSCCIVM